MEQKITPDELYALFGSSIPLEAVRILFDKQHPPGTTVGDVRREITAYAMTWKANQQLALEFACSG
jgi:hypothetical protein